MNQRLENLFIKIEAQRKTLLLLLKDRSNESLNEHLPGKWSINQIIAHLITAEKLSVQYLNKKILGVKEVDDTGLLEELKMLLLIVSQRMPLKFKAPKVVVDHTSNETDFIKLKEDWDNTRSELKHLLNRFEDQHLQRKIYRHVRVGMLNIQHTVRFFGEHVGHHTPQIKYLLKEK